MRPILTAGVVIALAASLTSAASGAGVERARRLPPRQVLHSVAYAVNRQGETTGVRKLVPRWRRGDSPADADLRALRVTLPQPGKSGSYEADTAPRSTRQESRPVGRVKNLSFDFRRRTQQARDYRAPAIAILARSKDELLLWGRQCRKPISHTWSRADFTGALSGCKLTAYVYAEGYDAHTYKANGRRSAWGAYVAANPDEVLESTTLLFEGPLRGQREQFKYAVDRLSLGGGFQYNHSNIRARACLGLERRC
jgi:hypothetical protein